MVWHDGNDGSKLPFETIGLTTESGLPLRFKLNDVYRVELLAKPKDYVSIQFNSGQRFVIPDAGMALVDELVKRCDLSSDPSRKNTWLGWLSRQVVGD